MLNMKMQFERLCGEEKRNRMSKFDILFIYQSCTIAYLSTSLASKHLSRGRTLECESEISGLTCCTLHISRAHTFSLQQAKAPTSWGGEIITRLKSEPTACSMAMAGRQLDGWQSSLHCMKSNIFFEVNLYPQLSWMK